jgi:hypothetical protein
LLNSNPSDLYLQIARIRGVSHRSLLASELSVFILYLAWYFVKFLENELSYCNENNRQLKIK